MSAVGKAVSAVAGRWGVTEGQVYTAFIGGFVALAAAVGGIPPTLADRPNVSDDSSPTQAQPRASTRQTTTTQPNPGEAASPESALVFPGAAPLVSSRTGQFSPPPPPRPSTPAARLSPGAFRVFASVPLPGSPQGIAVSRNGRVAVATNNGDGRGADGRPVVFGYGADGVVAKKVTLDGVASGGGVHDLVLPPGGTGDIVYGVSSIPPAVWLVDLGQERASTFVEVPDIPPCAPAVRGEPCEISPIDNPPVPAATAFDGDGNLVVADAKQGVLWRVKADGSISLFFKARDFVALDGLSGVALGHDGALFLSLAQSATAGGKGLIYRLADGRLTQFAQTDAGTAPRGLTVGRSGRIYVTLSGRGRVAILDKEGDTVASLPTDPASTYDTPVRVAFSPTALTLVEQAPSRAQAGRVVELGVDDEALHPAG